MLALNAASHEVVRCYMGIDLRVQGNSNMQQKFHFDTIKILFLASVIIKHTMI